MKGSGLVRSLIRGLGDVLSACGEADGRVLLLASRTGVRPRLPTRAWHKGRSSPEFVASGLVPICRCTAKAFAPVFNLPYCSQAFDVSFSTSTHGFASHFNTRTLRGVINETFNGGLTWDTLYSASTSIQRVFTNRIRSASDTLFLVGGGGSPTLAVFHKYTPATRSFAVQQSSLTGAVADIDF